MPDISIIVPTFNRAASLVRTLQSVAEVVPPNAPVEIIVVDNRSTDQTREAFNTISAKFPDRDLRYIYEPMPGLLSGRHRGAAEAKGGILSFLDDDVLLAESWVDALQDAFADPTVALVGGPSRPGYEVEPPKWLKDFWWQSDEDRWCGFLSLIDQGPSVKPISPMSVWGLNFSIRKTVFQTCGGFHPDCIPKTLQRYQGDGEAGLSLKVSERGLRALYHPGVAVTHVIPASRLTPEGLKQRNFYQGVCDSYAQIRRERQLPLAQQRFWKDWLRPVKRRVEKMLRNAPIDQVRRLMARAYFEGVHFHQCEVRKDPKLLAWVLKEDYFNYSLPEGWEGYVR